MGNFANEPRYGSNYKDALGFETEPVYSGNSDQGVRSLLDELKDVYDLDFWDWVDPKRPGFELNSHTLLDFVILSKDDDEFEIQRSNIVNDHIHTVYTTNTIYSLKPGGGVSANRLESLKFDPDTTYALIFPKLEADGKRSVLALVRKDVRQTY